jgi:NMD protein affecting ribosome stability and mRNA decay
MRSTKGVTIMSHATISDGFFPIARRDGIFKERVPDAYKSQVNLSEPTVCSQCGAVFNQGHWQWGQAPENAHEAICPACHRIHDHYPAGFLTLKGEFFRAHREEIMRFVRNHEKHQRAEHPLKRIIAMEQKNGTTLVTTTSIHLARGIGELLHHAYQGVLKLHFNAEQKLLRVNWTH